MMKMNIRFKLLIFVIISILTMVGCDNEGNLSQASEVVVDYSIQDENDFENRVTGWITGDYSSESLEVAVEIDYCDTEKVFESLKNIVLNNCGDSYSYAYDGKDSNKILYTVGSNELKLRIDVYDAGENVYKFVFSSLNK